MWISACHIVCCQHSSKAVSIPAADDRDGFNLDQKLRLDQSWRGIGRARGHTADVPVDAGRPDALRLRVPALVLRLRPEVDDTSTPGPEICEKQRRRGFQNDVGRERGRGGIADMKSGSGDDLALKDEMCHLSDSSIM